MVVDVLKALRKRAVKDLQTFKHLDLDLNCSKGKPLPSGNMGTQGQASCFRSSEDLPADIGLALEL